MKRAVSTCALLLVACVSAAHAQSLEGLWTAKRRLGPDARGPLVIARTGNVYRADMMGLTVPVAARDGELTFELPDGAGGFRGKVNRNGVVRGVWFQRPRGDLGPGVSLTLMPAGQNRWSGNVVPEEDSQTFYLLLKPQANGSYSALIRNHERDWGATLGITSLVREGERVLLYGRRGTQTRDTLQMTGSFDAQRQVITLYFPFRGGSQDFRRDETQFSGFYPRGRQPERYTYRTPPSINDGWDVASVDDVDLDRAQIERTVQHLIDMSMDSVNAPQIHSLLIVRRGKLVLEEYFHGEHRDKPHNVRSGSKSVTATIVGAAMHAGVPIKLSSPVYQVMHGGSFPAGLEERKRAMTLEHLLTMSSGYFCDDNNPEAPGNENALWDREDAPDFYKYTLTVPMAFGPGEKGVYCSINPNLALGMLGRAAGESPFFLFERLVAAPLGIRNYVWAMDPDRNPYGGGGMGLLARDFIKFGQLMLDSGTWKGKRILSREFVARTTSPLVRIGQRDYGLAWWREKKPYKGGVAKSYAMLGAGGNIVMVYPDLDLIVATTGGSYISRGWRYAGGELLPNWVLPAVR